MRRFGIRVMTDGGELAVEADSMEELRAGMEEAGLAASKIERYLTVPPNVAPPSEVAGTISGNRADISDLFEFDSSGYPHALVSLVGLNARETIGLLMFSKDPTPLTVSELDRIVSTNWKSVGVEYLSAVMSQLKQYMIKEGEKGSSTYRLSGAGRRWIIDTVIKKLRGSRINDQ